MEYRALGASGIQVSRLCFGTLTMGPLQARMPLEEGVNLIASAVRAGVNFIDTAELYRTYSYIRKALDLLGIEGRDVVIASRSYAYTYEGMRKSIRDALRAIGRDRIDIFLMHEQESRETLRGHADALRCLVDAKKAGTVRAIGVSTHFVEVVKAAAGIDEIDVIHPLLNMKGIGIRDGEAKEMAEAIKFARGNGKGIYGMKALAGGNLVSDVEGALRFVLDNPYIDSVAVGMKSEGELRVNLGIFSNEAVPLDLLRAARRGKRLLIENWCTGCGRCVIRCKYGALKVRGKRVRVEHGKCILCGYCAAACEQFCIKVI